MMGVGKSTLGKIVAKKQDLLFIDTDLNIEKKLSMTISDIFEKKGEVFFREKEEEEVLESLKKKLVYLSVISLSLLISCLIFFSLLFSVLCFF